jgi:RNA polymerase sigma factor (sigma-70 family)
MTIEDTDLPRILPVEEVNRLVVENKGLAYQYALNRARAYGPRFRDDILAEALVGLHKAAMHFDPERERKFSTYAVRWIKYYVQRFLHKTRGSTRTPGTEGYERLKAAMLSAVDIDDVSSMEIASPWPSSDDHVERMQRADACWAAISELPDIQAKLIIQRYIETEDGEPETFEAVGKRLGYSREWARKQEVKALAQLRESLSQKLKETA